MKSDLTQYISSIFQALGFNAEFVVYDCEKDEIPKWLDGQSMTYEYVVCCSDCSIQDKLSKFINKDIRVIDNHIYWFEGLQLSNSVSKNIPEDDTRIELSTKFQLKTNTRLATWIDDVIFNKLKAEYSPDHILFESNLELSSKNLCRYLGTYFPRSYAESFCIFNNIFHNPIYKSEISPKKNISILSIGCGTGGDILGLLTALDKVLTNISQVEIWAFDGNQQALDILSTLLSEYTSRTNKTIKYNIRHQVLTSVSSLDLSDIKDIPMDFIVSSKFINELISSGKGSLDNSYFDFAALVLPHLSTNGLCLLLDVTTKAAHTTYNPILMNHQINNALRNLKIFKTLLPLSCLYYGDRCDVDCFCQKMFTVKHSRFVDDKSKVAYRVLGRQEVVDKIITQQNRQQLVIHDNDICPHSVSFDVKADAYYLPKECE